MEKIQTHQRHMIKQGEPGDSIEMNFSKKLVPNLCAMIQRVVKRSEHLYLTMSIPKGTITIYCKEQIQAKNSRPKCYFILNYKKLEQAKLLTISRHENITLYFYRREMLKVLEVYKLFGKDESLTLNYRKYKDLYDKNLLIKIGRTTIKTVSYPERDPVILQFNTTDHWHLRLNQGVISRLRNCLREIGTENKTKQSGGFFLIDLAKIKFYPGIDDDDKIVFEDEVLPGKSVYVEYLNNNPNIEINEESFHEMVKLLTSQLEGVERNLEISSYAIKLYLTYELLSLLSAKKPKEKVYIVDDLVYDDKISLSINFNRENQTCKLNFYSKNKVNGESVEEIYFNEANISIFLITKKSDSKEINIRHREANNNKAKKRDSNNEKESLKVGIVNQSFLLDNSGFIQMGTSPNRTRNASISNNINIKKNFYAETNNLNLEEFKDHENKANVEPIGFQSNPSNNNFKMNHFSISDVSKSGLNFKKFEENVIASKNLKNVFDLEKNQKQTFTNKIIESTNPKDIYSNLNLLNNISLQSNNNFLLKDTFSKPIESRIKNILEINNPNYINPNKAFGVEEQITNPFLTKKQEIDIQNQLPKLNPNASKPNEQPKPKFECDLSKIESYKIDIDSDKTLKNLNEVLNNLDKNKPIQKKEAEVNINAKDASIEDSNIESSKQIEDSTIIKEQDSVVLKENNPKKKKAANTKKNKKKEK